MYLEKLKKFFHRHNWDEKWVDSDYVKDMCFNIRFCKKCGIKQIRLAGNDSFHLYKPKEYPQGWIDLYEWKKLSETRYVAFEWVREYNLKEVEAAIRAFEKTFPEGEIDMEIDTTKMNHKEFCDWSAGYILGEMVKGKMYGAVCCVINLAEGRGTHKNYIEKSKIKIERGKLQNTVVEIEDRKIIPISIEDVSVGDRVKIQKGILPDESKYYEDRVGVIVNKGIDACDDPYFDVKIDDFYDRFQFEELTFLG